MLYNSNNYSVNPVVMSRGFVAGEILRGQEFIRIWRRTGSIIMAAESSTLKVESKNNLNLFFTVCLEL